MKTKKELAKYLGLKSEAMIKSYLDELGFKKKRNEDYPKEIITKCLELRESRKHRKGGTTNIDPEKQAIANEKRKLWAKEHAEEHRLKTIEGMRKLHDKLSKAQKDYIKKSGINPYKYLKKYYEGKGREAYSRNTPRGKSRYMYNGEAYDSSFELIFKLCYPTAKRCNKYFEYEYNGEKHKYWPDFELDGKYYELKGPHFFKNGKMINPFDRSMDDIYEAKHQCMINNNVTIITDVNYYKETVERNYCPNYWTLFDTKLPFPFTDDIYKCHRKGKKSPYEAWNDMSLRQKAIENRLTYGRFGEYHTCDRIYPEDVVTAFSVMKIAPKVSNFSATRAYTLSRKYLSSAKTIVDPFAGFGGRKQGCEDAGFTYIGFDREIKNKLDITERDVLDMKEIETYDALFTCPPYSDKEEWLKPMEVIKSCDEWIRVCLSKFNCKLYLFVVDDTEDYKDYVTELIENKSHLNTNYEKVILIKNDL